MSNYSFIQSPGVESYPESTHSIYSPKGYPFNTPFLTQKINSPTIIFYDHRPGIVSIDKGDMIRFVDQSRIPYLIKRNEVQSLFKGGSHYFDIWGTPIADTNYLKEDLQALEHLGKFV